MHTILQSKLAPGAKGIYFVVVAPPPSLPHAMTFYSSGGQPQVLAGETFYTLCHIKNTAAKTWGQAWKNKGTDAESIEWVALDIDDVPADIDKRRIVDALEKGVWGGLAGEDCERYYVDSGHGVHALTRIPRQEPAFMKKVHAAYKELCIKITEDLRLIDIESWADQVIYEPSRILRLPNTRNHKLGQEEVMCTLLKSYGTIGNESLVLLDWMKSDTSRKTTGKKYTDLVIRNLKKPAIDCGRYYRIHCPVHPPDADPSFVMYKDGGGWGLDLHDGKKISPDKMLTLIMMNGGATKKEPKGNTVEKSSETIAPTLQIIKAWADKKFAFTYSDKGSLYSSATQKTLSMYQFSHAFDDGILTVLHERAAELSEGKKPAIRSMPGFYRNWCGGVFSEFLASLPCKDAMNDAALTEHNVDIIKLKIRRILHEVRIWSDGQGGVFRRSFLDRVTEGPEGEWLRVDRYDFYALHRSGEKNAAVTWNWLLQTDSKWAEDFANEKKFFEVLGLMGLGKLTSISVTIPSPMTVRAFVLHLDKL